MAEDGCEFCEGREAFEHGDPIESNPHPPPPDALREQGGEAYHTHPHVFWRHGYTSGPVIRDALEDIQRPED